MPFMKGLVPIRRTKKYLEQGNFFLRNSIRILTFGFNTADKNEPHEGLKSFVFWHLPQLQYKNPSVQMLTINNLTPTPWIKGYFDDDSEILIDCFGRSRSEIHDHLQRVFGLPQEMLESEEQKHVANPANFGPDCLRQCICEVPGQVPCPAVVPLPAEKTGKGRKAILLKLKEEEEKAELAQRTQQQKH